MLGRCYACMQELTAADGPNLLGSPDGPGTPRHAFHLRCWQASQAERAVHALGAQRQFSGRVSRNGSTRQAA